MQPDNQQTQPNPNVQAQPQPGVISGAQQPITGNNTKESQTKDQVSNPINPNSTQNTLLFSEIRDDMIIMRDGSFRAIVACKSINFDLMSSREREGVEFGYQNFVNSLTFPVQILIRSQRIDIGPYIEKLVKIRQSQDNMLLNVLMDDYIDFIDILSQEANIMNKSFFVIVPYYPAGNVSNMIEAGKGFFGKFFQKTTTSITKVNRDVYDKAKDEIKNNANLIINGLSQIGVQSIRLNTKEIIELYYNSYNPDTSVREPLGDFNKMSTIYTTKGEGESINADLREGIM